MLIAAGSCCAAKVKIFSTLLPVARSCRLIPGVDVAEINALETVEIIGVLSGLAHAVAHLARHELRDYRRTERAALRGSPLASTSVSLSTQPRPRCGVGCSGCCFAEARVPVAALALIFPGRV